MSEKQKFKRMIEQKIKRLNDEYQENLENEYTRFTYEQLQEEKIQQEQKDRLFEIMKQYYKRRNEIKNNILDRSSSSSPEIHKMEKKVEECFSPIYKGKINLS